MRAALLISSTAITSTACIGVCVGACLGACSVDAPPDLGSTQQTSIV
jgi:hypothetical protein